MKKVLFSLISVVVINIIPLLWNYELIFTYQTLIIVLEGLCLLLTQPSFSISETKENKDTDKFSILLIFIASTLSVVFAEVEWAYFKTENINVALTIIGLIAIFLGLGLRIWAIRTLGKHFTATARLNEKHQLISSGPYSLVKHPSYTGAFFCIVGVSLFLNSTISIFLSTIMLLFAYYLRTKSEEKMLILYFGDDYIIYSRNKKKLFPFIW